MRSYSDEVPMDVYDRNIVAHPWVDSCNAAIVWQLSKLRPSRGESLRVLDVGTGTGQVVRLLRDLPGVRVEAQDIDPAVSQWFSAHPELRGIPLHVCALGELFASSDGHPFDVTVSRGVYHHIPKSDRVRFVRETLSLAPVHILADEMVAEFATPDVRLENCNSWYGHVIAEARRRGLPELAGMENAFLLHERDSSADDGLDYKESPQQLQEEAVAAGGKVSALMRIGPWKESRGGFVVALLERRDSQ